MNSSNTDLVPSVYREVEGPKSAVMSKKGQFGEKIEVMRTKDLGTVW